MYFDEWGELSLGLGFFIAGVDLRPFFQSNLYVAPYETSTKLCHPAVRVLTRMSPEERHLDRVARRVRSGM